jgi:hypothetical protein
MGIEPEGSDGVSFSQATYLACHIQIIQGFSLRPTIAKEVNEYHGKEKTRKNGLLQNE